MINAEVIVDDIGAWNNTTKTWTNVQMHVRYPIGPVNGVIQTIDNNPISNNDILVDRTGKVWRLTSVSRNGSTFSCTMADLLSSNPTSSRQPDAYSEKNLVITPNTNGLLSPYYHDSYIATTVFRAAMAYNMDKLASS